MNFGLFTWASTETHGIARFTGGTTGVIALLVATLAMGPLWLAVLLPVCGYGFAWFGHFVVERNRPATFLYPRWSLLADFKMYGLALRGRMDREVIHLYGSGIPRQMRFAQAPTSGIVRGGPLRWRERESR